MARIDRNIMFMKVAQVIAMRSTCTRKRVGCVIVDPKNNIISTSYNGSPPGEPHCIDDGCILGESGGCIRTTHAEINALNKIKTSMYHLLNGSTVFVTLSPCLPCAMQLAQWGIERVYYLEKYHSCDGAITYLRDKGIRVIPINPRDMEYYKL